MNGAMLFFLYSVLVTFVASFTSAQVTRFRITVHENSLDGKVSDDHLLFLTDVSTKLGCASFCMRYDSCVAFSTSPKDPSSNMMECRVHDSMLISQSSAVAAPGSKTYFMESGLKESSWLERPCTANYDCPATVTNVTCFADQCLCYPGYYYSHSHDDCVADCDLQDLQSTFLKYANRSLNGNNMVSMKNCNTYAEASVRCLQESQCRSFDIKLDKNKCYPQDATAADDILQIRNASDYYQRTCS